MARIDEDTIRQIKEANDIVDVISSYIPLVQKGKNYFAVKSDLGCSGQLPRNE